MNLRTCLLAGVSVLIGLLLALVAVDVTSAQSSAPKTAAASPVGRYQMAVSNGAVVVHDTTTGTCWFHDAKKWNSLGNPTDPPADK